MPSSLDTVRVVLFSGGRGSGVLSKQLLKDPHIRLTLAINGYDDGASTGEVRRFLGDSLGPSDFRKNASRLALELGTCPPSLVEMLDAVCRTAYPRRSPGHDSSAKRQPPSVSARVERSLKSSSRAVARSTSMIAALATWFSPAAFLKAVGNSIGRSTTTVRWSDCRLVSSKMSRTGQTLISSPSAREGSSRKRRRDRRRSARTGFRKSI